MSATPLKTATSTLPAETAEFLRELTARADAGEVISVTVVAELNDGCYEINRSRSLSRLQTIGALFDAAVSRAMEQ